MSRIVKPGDVVLVRKGGLFVDPETYEVLRDVNEKIYAQIVEINIGSRQYRVKGLDFDFDAECNQDAIIEKHSIGCTHSNGIVWSDKEEQWVCGFCLSD